MKMTVDLFSFQVCIEFKLSWSFVKFWLDHSCVALVSRLHWMHIFVCTTAHLSLLTLVSSWLNIYLMLSYLVCVASLNNLGVAEIVKEWSGKMRAWEISLKKAVWRRLCSNFREAKTSPCFRCSLELCIQPYALYWERVLLLGSEYFW